MCTFDTFYRKKSYLMKIYTLRNLKMWSILVLLMSSISSTFAQRTITGVVSDESGTTLIGANVLVKGTSLGTITDIDGSYELNVEDDATILVFSYTGYTTVELEIKENVVNATLAEGELLDEIVLIGYGEVKREDATGLVSTVSSDDFNKGAIASPQQLLAGKVAGVTITNDGSPGGGGDIRIRGESSLGASNNPLIILDGVPLESNNVSGSRNSLNMINPADIESMTVLKDASATAIYGSRASGGVILITSKKGKSGQLKVGYSAAVSSGSIANKVNVLDGDAFRDAVRSTVDTSNSAYQLLTDGNTDWQDEIYQNSFGMEHNLNASGGIGGVPVRGSVGYSTFDGLLKTDNFSRYTGNLNVSPSFLDNRLQVKVGVKASSIANRFADKGAIGSALSFDPTKPVKADNPRFDDYFYWKGEDGNRVGLSTSNPVAQLEQKEDKSTVNRYITNASIDYRFGFLPALRANLNLGYDYQKGEGTTFIDSTAAFSYDRLTGGGTDNEYSEVKKNALLDFYLNYKKELFGNDFDIMAGYSWQRFFDENQEIRSNAANIPENTDTIALDPRELYIISLFSRVNYNIGNKILLTGTIRQDNTSRFSPEQRTGYFPSAAVAVKLRETNGDLLNQLKLRLSWGITGQQDIGGYYLWQGLYEDGDLRTRYQFGDQFVTTTRPNGYDANIKWESTTTYNAGIDFSLIRNRLGGTIDVYQRDTKDLLVDNVATVVGSNLTNVIATNLGTMTSKGVELSLNITPILTDNAAWDISLNTSYNKNEVTKLSNDATSFGTEVGGIAGGVGTNIQVHSVGFEPYSFYVYEQVYDEAGNIIPGEFADLNGDGSITEEDRYRIQATRPDFTFGLSSNYRYKNFDFSLAARSSVGNKVYNNLQTEIGNTDRIPNAGYLQNVHEIAITQGIEKQADVQKSDYFVQDASFLRVDHITLGYTFPKLLGEYFRVYGTVQNPILLTAYEGIDPEVFSGIDNNVYPRSRTFVFGLSVQF